MAWFTLGSSIETSLLGRLSVQAADGTELVYGDDYEATFQRYDADAEAMVDFEYGEDFEGPLLLSITPTEDSGYTGVLQEWVLVEGHAGSVREMYTGISAVTADGMSASSNLAGSTTTGSTLSKTGDFITRVIVIVLVCVAAAAVVALVLTRRHKRRAS